MKNLTNIQAEAIEVCDGILKQVNFQLERGGKLSRSTAKAFEELMSAVECRKYGEAVDILESLRLTKPDLKAVYYVPIKWLCALQVVKECLYRGETVRDSLQKDIAAEIAEKLGAWSKGCLIHPHPDNLYLRYCRDNTITESKGAALGYLLKH